jgi:hypothetical protein
MEALTATIKLLKAFCSYFTCTHTHTHAHTHTHTPDSLKSTSEMRVMESHVMKLDPKTSNNVTTTGKIF